jgi:hypothetical protein
LNKPAHPTGIVSLQRLLARREHIPFLQKLLSALDDATPSQRDYLKALGGEGLHILLIDEPASKLLITYAELLVAGKIHAPADLILRLYEKVPSPGLSAITEALTRPVIDNRTVLSAQAQQFSAIPVVQVKRVVQVIDMGIGSYCVSDALGIRRSVFRSEQERTFLQALALRFPGLHAFPNYPLDQLADFDKLKNFLDKETIAFGLRCRIDAVLVVPGEGDPVAAFELDSKLHDEPAQLKRDGLRNRLFQVIQIPLFRLRAEHCHSVSIDEWYALLTDEVSDKIDCGRRIRIRTSHARLVPI